jgi:SAM-dependent methyltransferase
MKTSVSSHYLGEEGKKYVAQRQSAYLQKGLKTNAERLIPYLKKSDVVLDFGCGPGALMKLLSEHVARIDGLEVNPTAAQIAREANSGTIFESLDAIPREPKYDAITTNHVLEHVREIVLTLETLRSLLKSGGSLIVVLPIDDFRAAHQRRWDKNDVDHHLATWTPRLFANVLFEAGFEVKECRVITSAWPPRRLAFLMVPGLEGILSWLTAVVRHRRQLMAIAVAP